MSNPTFGQQQDGVTYQKRLGVYAVVPDPSHEKIILVQAPNGAWFLPGGEIEAGEDQLTALARELVEELGFKAEFGRFYGQADEYFYSSHRDKHFYNPAFIYQVTAFTKIGQPLEDFNHLSWFSIEEAKQKVKRGSHRWGIEAWQEDQQKK